MRGFPILTILLLINTFTLVKSKKFYFSFYVNLICRVPNRDSFGYSIQFFDKDVVWLNGPDAITQPYIDHSSPPDTGFKVTGTMTGDEIWSDYFDVYANLYHNCNTANKETKVTIHLLPLFEIGKLSDDKFYQYYLTKDITELSGELTHTGKLDQN